MSDNFLKRFRLDAENEIMSIGIPATEDYKHKRKHRSGKVDVRSFLPRGNATASTFDFHGFAVPPAQNQNIGTPITQTLAPNNANTTNYTSDGELANKYNKAMGLKKSKVNSNLSGSWKPTDDLMLIISVFQVNDLDIVYALNKFSCKFTFEEVQTRWNALLYNDVVSSTSRAAIRKINPEIRWAIHCRAPFSSAEEDLLCDIGSNHNPHLKDFQALLEKYAETFYPARTAKSLQNHWFLLKSYYLLCDQRPPSAFCASGILPPDFSELELTDSLENASIDSEMDLHVNQELRLWDQQIKHRTRLLEDELDHWMILLNVPRKNLNLKPEFDAKTFAIIRGKSIQYAMRNNLMTFGRATECGENIDLDLSQEGPAFKISRLQGSIELQDDGRFIISNFGKHTFFVNGKALLHNRSMCLNDNTILEIIELTLLFCINKALVEHVCFTDSVSTDADSMAK